MLVKAAAAGRAAAAASPFGCCSSSRSSRGSIGVRLGAAVSAVAAAGGKDPGCSSLGFRSQARRPAAAQQYPHCSSSRSSSRSFASFDLPRHPTRAAAALADRGRAQARLADPGAADDLAAAVAGDPDGGLASFVAALPAAAAAAGGDTAAAAAGAAAATAAADKVYVPYLFLDPSGEHIPLLRHCSLDQRDGPAAARTAAAEPVQGATAADAAAATADAAAVAAPGQDSSVVTSGFAGVGVEDVGRFRLFARQRLLQLLPEGCAGCRFKQERQQPAAAAAAPAVESGFLLDGHRGVGKSFVLNYLVAWARENEWLVVYEPLPSKYARDIGDIRRSSAGVYIQSAFARVFLERLLLFNEKLLREIPVDFQVYGTSALDGVHRDYAALAYESLLETVVAQDLEEMKAEACKSAGVDPDVEGLDEAIRWQREKLKLWQAYKKDALGLRLRGLVGGLRFRVWGLCRCRLARPSSVAEIALFGAEQEAFSTQAAYEVMEQLKKQNVFNLLVVVDEWNECFPVSEYVSMRYENTKFNGRVPAYHLSLPRLLSPYNGTQFKRGLKIVATSWSRMRRRNYQPELLGVRPEDIRTVRSFSPLEFAAYAAYLQEQGPATALKPGGFSPPYTDCFRLPQRLLSQRPSCVSPDPDQQWSLTGHATGSRFNFKRGSAACCVQETSETCK
ncbi:hypothetical protein Esti_002015 [Eimeria stiedai]